MPRIQLKVVALLFALVGLVSITAGVFAERSLRSREVDGIERSLVERSELVRALLSGRELLVEQRAALQALAVRAGPAADARVSLVAADGTVVADSNVSLDRLPGIENHSDRPELKAAFEGRVGVSQRRSRTVGRRLLYVAVPFSPEPGGGAVRLAVDLDGVEAAARELRRTLFLAGGIGLLAALVLSWVSSSVALRALHAFGDVVSAIARGELDRRVEWHSNDELDELAKAVNEMADQLQARLRELTGEKEQLQAVLASMVEGVLVLDRAGRVEIANPRFRELFGVDGEITGRAPIEVARHTGVVEALEEAIRSRKPIVQEIDVGQPEPRRLQLHAVSFPERGPLDGTVAVFHDITEIRRLEGFRRDFVANVSHELKTPLTAIRGFAETLSSGPIGEEQRRHYLEVIQRHADRLAGLIDDILTLSRIESGQVALDREPVDVSGVARALANGMRPLLESKSLRLEIDPDSPLVLADRSAVETILQNLLVNAAEYTPENGRIQVSARRLGELVETSVVDDGAGIPREHLPRIFERFYRVDKARSRELGGTGLGLSIVKHLVQIHGGEVAAESQPGQGSTFKFTLPAS